MSEWLLGTLLATSVLVALVLLVREPVRSRFGSRVTYGLWLIPAARLLMPTLTTTVERTVPAGTPVRALMQPVAGEPMLLSNVATPEPALWPVILLAAWLSVAAALFVSRMVAFHRDRRAILASGVEVARAGSVRIVSSPEVASPVAFGIRDRVIAIPADFDRLYDARERRLALEHELAHHKSGDLVANLFAFVLLCLQWFNPLAWVAHAAFRFDQEAACDARVLDKAKAGDRADYGRAIAKAASGRALLFASALDRRNTLHRRLQSMLRHSNPTQRIAGQMLVGIAIAVALPLTASRAIDYIDVPVSPPAPQAAAVPAAIPAAAAVARAAPHQAAPVIALAAAAPARAERYNGQLDLRIDGDTVTINGVTKRWDQLTPAEREKVRQDVARARRELANAHIDRAEIERNIRQSMVGFDIDREELARNIRDSKAEVEQAMRQVDANAEHLRRAGQDPEAIKAHIRVSLESVKSIDVEALRRDALASVNPETIAASVAAAEASIARARAELDRIDARLRDERR